MKLIDFPEVNCTYAKDQPEYKPLPCHKFSGMGEGMIVCCWKLSFIERLKMLITGKIWHSVLTFNQPLQPQLLEVDKPQIWEQVAELGAGVSEKAWDSLPNDLSKQN